MRGSVVKRGSGYSIVLDLDRDPSGKRRQKRISGFPTRKDAENRLAELITQVSKGQYVVAGDMTLSEYLPRWFDAHKEGLSHSTLLRYDGIVRQHLIPALGKLPLQKLQALHIQDFLKAELENGRRDNKKTVGTGLSAAAVRYEYRVLRVALGRAVEWGMLSRNVAEYVKVPRSAKREISVLDEKQIAILLQSLGGDYLHLPVFLAVYTGMRMGEILGLRWEDVDLTKGIINLRRASIQRKAGMPEFREPKTPRSRRSIDISLEVVNTLKEYHRQQASWKLAAGELWEGNDLVCCHENGSPINPPTLSSRFRTFAANQNLAVTFHQLRHAHASLLIKAGVPVKVISERLGHSSVAITMDIYGHLLPGMQREAAEAFERLLLGIGNHREIASL